MKLKALVTAELVRLRLALTPSARDHNVFRDGEVFKVTHPDDIEIAELMLRRRNG